MLKWEVNMFGRERKILGSVVLAMGVLGLWLPVQAEAQMSNGVLLGWSRTDWNYEVPNVQQGDIFAAKNGFQVGLFFTKPLSTELSLRGELLYARKGAKESQIAVSENGDPLGSFDMFYNADYFQVPVILNYALMSEGGMRPVLMAGPYLAFKYSSRQKGDIPPLQPNKSVANEQEDFSSTDFGFILGGGLEFSQGARTFLLQVRYDLGLTDAFLTTKNKAWTIMTGIGF